MAVRYGSEESFRRELEEEDKRRKEAFGIGRRRVEAIRGIEGAERDAAGQQMGAVRRRTGQAVAASFDPFQARGGGQLASLGQVAADRGAQEGMIEADATRRIASARVAAETADLERLKFEQEATPSARQELMDYQQQIQQFAELDKSDAEMADYIGELVRTARDPSVVTRLLTQMGRYDEDAALQLGRQLNQSRTSGEDL